MTFLTRRPASGGRLGVRLTVMTPLPEPQHDYWPSAMHQGDCMVCGNTQDHPVHRKERHDDA